MMKWNIVTDSSCDLMEKDVDTTAVGFSTVPFVLRIGERDYIDDEQLDVLDMLTSMEACPTIGTSSCPSPEAWLSQFEKAEQNIAITISGRLSGSLNSAMLAKDLLLSRDPEKKLVVLNSRSTGPEIALCIHHLVDWIKRGHAFENVVAKAEKFLQDTKTTFALSSFDNLVKNGRMGRLTGFVARKLGMWGIGIASEEGTIEMKGKSRGSEKALALILADMQERGFSGGEVAISHCENLDMAERLRSSIQSHWKTAKVRILKTRGLDSFYAERGGLIVAFC